MRPTLSAIIQHAHRLVAIALLVSLAGCDIRTTRPPAGPDEVKSDAMKTTPPTPPAGATTTPTAPPPRHIVIGQPRHTYPLAREIAPVTAPGQPAIRIVAQQPGLLRLALPLADGEAIWGFGQRMDAFNLRGRTLETWTTDGWNAMHTSYYAVPFFISSTGYGLFINSPLRLKIDIGWTQPGELLIEIPDDGADVYLFEGTPAEVSRAYTELVGRPRYVPDWIFRPWVSRNSYLGAYEVDHIVHRMEELGMPVGVVVLEAWEEQLHNFKFTEYRYPDPKGWLARLKEKDVHVVCWLTSSVWTGTRAYEEAKQKGFLVLNPDGSEHIVRWLENGRKIDFRKPGAFEWWRDLHKPLVEMGVAGFKTDGGEHMPDPVFHNQHTYIYQKAALDAFTESGLEGITFARSANPLNASLGAYWAGDQHAEWSRLLMVLRAGLSTSLSGFPLWAHDIGAYTGDPSKELYIRWMQIGAFSPIMQFHGILAREPWIFDAQTVELARFYCGVREKLRPKLLEWAKGVKDGEPILRPLVWHFPDDAVARSLESQFMLGPDLIVAPVLDPLDACGVYLPRGQWVDLWSGETLAGPTQFLRRATLAQIPVYARAEAADDYRGLFEGAPVISTNTIAVRLIGNTNEYGISRTLRYWKAGASAERLYYEVKNPTAADVDLEITLPAPEGFSVEPSAPLHLRIPAGGVQRLAYSVKPVKDRLAPFTYAFRLQVRGGGRPIDTPPVGVVISPRWHVAGLFEGGVGSVQSLDAQPVRLNETFSGKFARPVAWKEVPDTVMNENGRYDLSSLTGAEGWSSLFLSTSITLDQPASLKLFAGFGDAMTLWVNGQLVKKIEGHRNPSRDEDVIPVRLPAGTHRILIRNSRDLSPPQFHFRVVD